MLIFENVYFEKMYSFKNTFKKYFLEKSNIKKISKIKKKVSKL